MKRIESDEEAVKYVKIGRDSTYKFIDMLYRTDWHFEKKTNDGVKLYSLKNVAGEPDYARYETKFGQVTVSELVGYFTEIDKRFAWENNYYSSLEQVKAYPLKTSVHYGKLVTKKGQPQKDKLLVTHGVEIQGNRQYLCSMAIEHVDYPTLDRV